VIFSATPFPAYAYLDPGTGSMMLQLLIGGIAGALVVIKLYWYKLKGFMTGKRSSAASTLTKKKTPPEGKG
jgi:hypothetical protein